MSRTNFLYGPLFHDPMLIIRLSLGLAFLWHGTPGVFNSDYMAGIISYMDMSGIPMPTASAYLSQGVELVCGLLLIIGLWTRPAALLLAINMAVASAVALLGANGDIANGEVNVLLLVMAIAVFLHGPTTTLSVD